MRKTCNHPFTLEGVEETEMAGCASHAEMFEKLIASSGKLVLLDKLLPRLQQDGHKVIIFFIFALFPSPFVSFSDLFFSKLES